MAWMGGDPSAASFQGGGRGEGLLPPAVQACLWEQQGGRQVSTRTQHVYLHRNSVAGTEHAPLFQRQPFLEARQMRTSDGPGHDSDSALVWTLLPARYTHTPLTVIAALGDVRGSPHALRWGTLRIREVKKPAPGFPAVNRQSLNSNPGSLNTTRF